MARALLIMPNLMLLDEPSAGLSPKVSTEVFDKIEEIEAINPEPGTRNLLTQTDRMSNLGAIPRYRKVYGHFYLMNNEV
jgi:ABC-type ATPase involved in cell division